MTHSGHPRSMDSDPTVLSEQSAAQLLARASELDQLRQAGSTVAELRAAAAEAGIAAPAFEAALAEVQRQPLAPAPRPRSRTLLATALATSFLAFIVAGAALVFISRGVRNATDAVSPTSLRDEAIVLQCLAPADAAELIRPLLTLPANQVVVRANGTTRVLALRVTAEQLAQVKATLAPYEAAGSPTCAARPAPR